MCGPWWPTATAAGCWSCWSRPETPGPTCPYGLDRDVSLAEVRVPVFDRPGELARITSLTTDIGVNIFDLEIAHSVEGGQGVAILVVDDEAIGSLLEALREQGYAPSSRPLS